MSSAWRPDAVAVLRAFAEGTATTIWDVLTGMVRETCSA
jgi:hypothetical protein